MAEELKACPFCSCTDIGEVTINPRLEPRHRRFKVYCKACQCRTSEHKTRKEARIYWNTRAQAQAAPEAEPVEVVAWLKSDGDGAWSSGEKRYMEHCSGNYSRHTATFYSVPLMTVAQHNRIMASAPQHDAELVELLRETVEDRSGAIHFMGTDLLDRIDAKLATLSAKP